MKTGERTISVSEIRQRRNTETSDGRIVNHEELPLHGSILGDLPLVRKEKERPARGNKEENKAIKEKAREAKTKGKTMVLTARAKVNMEAKEERKETKDGK